MLQERDESLVGGAVLLEGAGLGRDHLPTDVDAGFGRHLAVDREAVVVLAMPDPDREAVRRKLAQMRRGPEGDLLLGDRQRHGEADAGQDLIRPGVRRDDELACLEDGVVGDDLDAARHWR